MIPLHDSPDLVDPIMIAAFEGWNDAGEAASGVVDHLMQTWDSTTVAAVDPEEFYDFQVNRPVITIGSEGERELTWPTSRVAVCRPPGADRDVVLLRGIEPNMRWRKFCADLLDIAGELDVQVVVSLGALLADTPHTRPIPTTGTSSDPELTNRLSLEQSRYEGPTGIVGVFHDACRRQGLHTVSCWAAVPHYVAQPPCPKATLALLARVEEVLQIAVPLGDLPEQARAWERGVDELSREDSDVAEYVRSLEQSRDTADLPEAKGDAIAREFERYLRRRDSTD